MTLPQNGPGGWNREALVLFACLVIAAVVVAVVGR